MTTVHVQPIYSGKERKYIMSLKPVKGILPIPLELGTHDYDKLSKEGVPSLRPVTVATSFTLRGEEARKIEELYKAQMEQGQSPRQRRIERRKTYES